uniref:Laminin, beta 4 n=1 Tax=Nothobranchius furzeri TaxID=105023 RepID=A0A8C6MGH2_NOTFU
MKSSSFPVRVGLCPGCPLSPIQFIIFMDRISRLKSQDPRDLQDHEEQCIGSSCHPRVGDLMIGRAAQLSASSTCGLKGPQNYCIIGYLEGQEKCFTCDSRLPYHRNNPNSHHIENIISTSDHTGRRKWWQSENGVHQVSIQLDLEAMFQFSHLVLTFKSFRPAAMLVEQSKDFGQSWKVIRYFAEDCAVHFPSVPDEPAWNIDNVVCDSRYSSPEPSTGGEVVLKALDPVFEIENPNAPEIQNLITLTNIRVNFTRLFTLGDTLLARRRRNPHVKYYYSLYNMVVQGRCFCNGHASRCVPEDRGRGDVHGRCVCQHNTAGKNCERCQEFYNDSPWKPGGQYTSNTCKRCNCHGHSDSCHFDADRYAATSGVSGGVCDDCRHNKTGPQCELCRPFLYQNPQRAMDDPHACIPCDCDPAGSLGDGLCDASSGQCFCKEHVEGQRCDRCKQGFFNLRQDSPTGCQGNTMISSLFSPFEQDYLPQSFWGLGNSVFSCSPCECDIGGAHNHTCFPEDGQCHCLPNIVGQHCSDPAHGYFLPSLNYFLYEAEHATPMTGGNSIPPRASSSVSPLHINRPGNALQIIPRQRLANKPEKWTGLGFVRVVDGAGLVFTVENLPASMEYQLVIHYEPEEMKCDPHKYICLLCYLFVWLSACRCNVIGSLRPACSKLGGFCECKPNVIGRCCDTCAPLTFGFGPEGCTRCECDPRGSVSEMCDQVRGQCACRSQIKGRRCDQCQSGLWGFPLCRLCDCNGLSEVCEELTGECVNCREHAAGPSCNRCEVGYYGNPVSGQSCQPCMCPDSLSSGRFFATSCQQDLKSSSVMCFCWEGHTGAHCDQCSPGFYGNLTLPGAHCQPCPCNNNIDPDDRDACDSLTGKCLHCLHNTRGPQCQHCILGYYGNALQSDCKECSCDRRGTEVGHCHQGRPCFCDPTTGQCPCRTRVAGVLCDECEDGSWDLSGALECQACRCDPANSISNICDKVTGQCPCHPGFGGRQCDKCGDSYFGNPDLQCLSCDCNLEGSEHPPCNPETGECLCRAGVAGISCDECAPGYESEFPSCKKCHPCTSLWIQNVTNAQKAAQRMKTFISHHGNNQHPPGKSDAEAMDEIRQLHQVFIADEKRIRNSNKVTMDSIDTRQEIKLKLSMCRNRGNLAALEQKVKELSEIKLNQKVRKHSPHQYLSFILFFIFRFYSVLKMEAMEQLLGLKPDICHFVHLKLSRFQFVCLLLSLPYCE